ncbi:MAG: ATP-binding protein [Candidatus Solibacter sp.]|nr:ATP-binding protein [Candidatus Solibacter sp.]
MPEKRWFWATLTLSSITIVSVVLAAWELVENRLFRDANYITLHYLYITRGVASSLLLAFWAAWFVLRQRRKSEADLRRSRDLYRGLLEAFPGAVILYDSELRVLEWNAPAERMYGYARAEILGARLPILPAAKAAELEDFLRRVQYGVPVLDMETLRQPRSGEPFEVQLSLLPFREGTGPLCFLEVTSDIRERVRWRHQMIEIEKLTSMGKMAAGTAHHLNSPLAALLIRTELIRRHSTGPAFDADRARIEEGLHFCRHFVQRLLDFTRASPSEKAPQDLATVIESIAGFFQPAILSRHANLIVDTSEGSGQLVFADRNLLETLLLTLLSNALDAVPAGGEIRLRCRRSPGTVGFTVSDNGCGIGPAQLEHVFEPFFTTKEPGKGTGLGLAIARNVVVEHGGSIEIESRPGEGTTASVDLPLAGVPEAVGRVAP